MIRSIFMWMACGITMLTALVVEAQGQTGIPFDDARWHFDGSGVRQEVFLGEKSLAINNGAAVLPDANFTNGIIRFDIALEKGRYFPGVGFRMQDGANGEVFYVRPHQSGNPDALQYYPEYNGAGGWQLYYGEGFNNAHILPAGKWIHVKILVSGQRAEVYFDDEPEPVLYIHALQRAVKAGMIELENRYPVTAHYANVSVTAMDTVALLNAPKPVFVLPEAVVRSWQVSEPFSEGELEHTALLDMAEPGPKGAARERAMGARAVGAGGKGTGTGAGAKAGSEKSIGPERFHWQTFLTDQRGIADLSRLEGSGPGHNTIFCRLTISSDREQFKKFSFGFSDRVRIFFNGKLIYMGQDVFMSRDYRFLGTVGYWDAILLDLKKGSNELWMAVSEDYGGWGVQARLDNL